MFGKKILKEAIFELQEKSKADAEMITFLKKQVNDACSSLIVLADDIVDLRFYNELLKTRVANLSQHIKELEAKKKPTKKPKK